MQRKQSQNFHLIEKKFMLLCKAFLFPETSNQTLDTSKWNNLIYIHFSIKIVVDCVGKYTQMVEHKSILLFPFAQLWLPEL